MAAPPADAVDAPVSSPRRAQRWLFVLALAALLAGSAIGVVVARQRAIDTASRGTRSAASRAAAALETELGAVAFALGGATAVVADDGTLDAAAFETFARDLAATGPVDHLWLVGDASRPGAPNPVLAVHDERAGITRRPPVGEPLGTTPAVAGLLRSAADAIGPVVGGVPPVAGADAGVLALRSLAAPGAGRTPVGYVATTLSADRLLATVADAVADEDIVSVHVGGSLLAGPPLDDRREVTEARAAVPGRSWTVAVEDRPVDLTGAWLVGIGGAAATLAMAALVVVTEKHQRRLGRANALLARSEERSHAAQEVAGRLARALSGGDVAAALFDHLPDAVGAQAVAIATAERDGALRAVVRDDDADAAGGPLLGLPAPGSIIDKAIRLAEPAWLSSPLGWRGDALTEQLSAGGSALAVLPLHAEEVVGVLAVAYPRLHIFSDEEQALLQTVAVLAARALARGRRYDAEHRAAVAFQRAALPDELPSVPGITVAARYRPATQGATVGGDWYDVLQLDESHLLLVVGDVVGHGMVAAAAMGRLRTAFQAIASFRPDPGPMVQAVSQQVDSIPDAFCATALAVRVDLDTGTITWCRAGHPPPLVLRSAGAELLDGHGLPPLGVAPQEIPAVHEQTLAPGDVLVLYTDGLVERREDPLDRGFQRLAIVAEQLVDLEPDELCDALVEALVPVDAQTDDIAVLVMRYDAAGT